MTGFLKDDSRSHKLRRHVLQVLKWSWDQLLLVATLILALYAFRQWKATNETLKEITRQTPAVIQSGKAAEDAVKVAAAEAKSSDETTQKTLGLMQAQAEAAKSLARTALIFGAICSILERRRGNFAYTEGLLSHFKCGAVLGVERKLSASIKNQKDT